MSGSLVVMPARILKGPPSPLRGPPSPSRGPPLRGPPISGIAQEITGGLSVSGAGFNKMPIQQLVFMVLSRHPHLCLSLCRIFEGKYFYILYVCSTVLVCYVRVQIYTPLLLSRGSKCSCVYSSVHLILVLSLNFPLS